MSAPEDLAQKLGPQLAPALEEILRFAESDFRDSRGRLYNPAEYDQIRELALERLRGRLADRSVASRGELMDQWRAVVREFYAENHWRERIRVTSAEPAAHERPGESFVRTFLFNMLVMKVCLLYFGVNYAHAPGEGYGWGFVATACASLALFGRFIYKNWGED